MHSNAREVSGNTVESFSSAIHRSSNNKHPDCSYLEMGMLMNKSVVFINKVSFIAAKEKIIDRLVAAFGEKNRNGVVFSDESSPKSYLHIPHLVHHKICINNYMDHLPGNLKPLLILY